MIDQPSAFSVFRKWRDSMKPLMVDAELGVIAFTFEGTLIRVEEPLVGFLLDDCGSIEFIFDESWGFDFASPDALRLAVETRVGESALRGRQYEYGETVFAVRSNGSRMIFLEIVKEVRP